MSKTTPRKLRILVPMHEDLVPPETTAGLTDEQIQPWKTEYDVVRTLENMGHEVRTLGLYDQVDALCDAIDDYRPQIAFNLAEEFHGDAIYHPHVASYLELKKLAYTGCNPRGMMLADDKALSKKILDYHRIHVPGFQVFAMNRKVVRPKALGFPLFVKSLTEDGSIGISQASIVRDDEKLIERVEFIHRQAASPAIAEEYIEGREIYVGVMGNRQLQTFTPWELSIANLPDGVPVIATGRVKWDYAYQKKAGVETKPAELTAKQKRDLANLSKTIYQHLSLSGYARLDFRLDLEGRFYLLEANANPNLSFGEDFSESAEHSGIGYEELLQRMLKLGLSYRRGK